MVRDTICDMYAIAAIRGVYFRELVSWFVYHLIVIDNRHYGYFIHCKIYLTFETTNKINGLQDKGKKKD